MTHLRRYLEEHGVLYPEQLAEAVRRQQIYGGSLDTVLLELELCDPVTLGELLERACGFPVVPPHLLDNGLPRPWTEIPQDMQRSRWVEPLSREGDEVLVAVHPDLPDDLLGKLLRNVRRLRPMVTPECCLEKVAAERHGSVVPQRYAVLCASYLSAVTRRPSVSGAFTVPSDEPPDFGAPQGTAEQSDVPRVRAPGRARPDVGARPVDRKSVAGSIDVVETLPMSLPAPPERSRRETAVDSARQSSSRPSSRPSPRAAAPAAATEVTRPAQVTHVMREEADVLRRLEQARIVLEAARSRDAALEAILDAALVLSPRVGLFRARGDELVGLSTPRSHLPDLGGKVVSASEGSAAGIAMKVGRYSGPAPEADLRQATGVGAASPCVLQRIQVRDRPVVFLYLDRDGSPIERRDLVWLGDLAELAGRVFEEILKLRRQPSAAHGAATVPTIPTPTARSIAPPTAKPPTAKPTPAKPTPRGGWGPPPPRVRASLGEEGVGEPIEPAPAEPPPSRVSTPDREHPDGKGPPPALVIPPPAPTEPAAWRLTPELAQRALDERTTVVREPPAAEAAQRTEAVEAKREPEAAPEQPEPEPPSTPEPEPPSTPEPEPPSTPEPQEPEPAPEPDEPEQPEPKPETPEPEIRPPRPEPEVTPTQPEPEVTPPRPEPEVTPPRPEPEITPPSPTPEMPQPQPGPEIPPPTYGATAAEPSTPRSDDVTQVGPPPAPPDDEAPVDAGPEPTPSQRPTIELPAIDENDVPVTLTRETLEIYSPPTTRDEPAPTSPNDERVAASPSSPSSPSMPAHDGEPEPTSRPSLSRLTMHSSPPPPPLPPPPMSAVDEPELGVGGRRARSPTIHGLPPPELKSRSGATKRVGPLPDALPILGGDEDVEIISLAAPIMPATARGRIELEDEDWVAPGSQLASDSQQGLIDAVIDAVVAGDAGVEALHEHGDAALLRLMAQFPGPLEVLRRDLRALPPPSAHGPLIRTVIAVGSPVVPHIIDLLEHPNPDVRFYAAFVFHELRDPRCMRPLAKLAFDTNGDVRVVSMRVLETYRRAEGYGLATAVVREQLDNEARAQQLNAARAAGTLRDIGAIPQLVELLASSDRFIQEASLESLCSITGQQHGLKPHRWRAWYEEHGHRHRVEWIIDSLRHRDLPVRRWAADELVRITGHRVPFSPMGDKRAREVAAKAWMDWWEVRGRELFGA